MEISVQQKELKKTAKKAGFLYLLIAITGAFGILYTPDQLIVLDNIALTSKNILANEFLFRLGIYSGLVCQTTFVFLAIALYKLFKDVNQNLTRTLFALVIVSVPISILIILNQFEALQLLKAPFMNSFEALDQQALAMSSLKLYMDGNLIIGIFWGLWLIPFGQLVIKSNFIPSFLGVLLILGGISYLIDASAFILFPQHQYMTNVLVSIFSSIAELGMILWLTIKGIRVGQAVKKS